MARPIDAATITFGNCAENGVGMQQVRPPGQLGDEVAEGFSYEDLVHAKWRFESAGCECEYIDLISAAGVELLGGERGPAPAHLLVVRRGIEALLAAGLNIREDEPTANAPADAPVIDVDELLAGVALYDVDDVARPAEVPLVVEAPLLRLTDALLAEQRGLSPDKKAIFRGEVKNKIARWNLCFAEASQEPAYEEGKGRIVAFDSLELTNAARAALPMFFGEKARNLVAEGNYYYDAQKCGIGFHGDAERCIVVALRLGVSIPLHYQWFHRWAPEGQRIAVSLDHGDLYAMSEKAVGADWKSSSIPTLRHAAGAAKYLTIKK